MRDRRQGALINDVAAHSSSPSSITTDHHRFAQDGPKDLRRQTHQQTGLIRCRWHPHARSPGRDILHPFSSVTFFFYPDGVERVSRDARASVRVANESRHRVRGGLRSSKDLRTIGRRWPPRSALTPIPATLLLKPLLFTVVDKFDYGFAENGLTAYKLGKQLPSQSFIKHVGEEKYKPLVNFILHYIADLDIPIKR